jgi:hypothetical protein
MRNQGNSVAWSVYTSVGANVGRFVGVENLSYMWESRDPVTGEPYSGKARAAYAVLGAGELVMTATGIKTSYSLAKGVASKIGSKIGSWWKGTPLLRTQYTNEVLALRNTFNELQALGKSEEEIARQLHAMRRELGIKYKELTPPEELARIRARNLAMYGDELGPTIEWLRARGKSWKDIIESAMRPGGLDLGY